MKTNPGWVWLACVIAASTATNLGAADRGVVKGNVVNVRGQPSVNSEVITQLKKGDSVAILEELTLKKPKPDEPAKWARIVMPTNTPVWVNAGYLDTNNTVKPARLNIRAGPGENFSVIGRLHKGDAVKAIRTADSWVEIEAGTNAYAYVAADLLTKTAEAPPAPTVAEKVEPPKTAEPPPTVATHVPPPAVATTEPAPKPAEIKPEPQVVPATAPTNTPATVTPPLAETKPAPVETKSAPTETKPATSATNAPPALPTPPPIAPALAPPPEEPAPKRIVQREGLVRGVVSVQAPTYFELVSPETGKVLNYLHCTSTNIVLKKYRGKKILVTGQELMDARWSKTPVLEIEDLRLAPDATK